MSEKSKVLSKKAVSHGAFKHRAKPATLQHYLKTYDIDRKSFNNVRAYVIGRLAHQSLAHASASK